MKNLFIFFAIDNCKSKRTPYAQTQTKSLERKLSKPLFVIRSARFFSLICIYYYKRICTVSNSPFSHCRFNLHRNRRGYSPVKGTACLTDSAVWRENALLLSESPYRNNWYPKIRFFVRSAKREDGNSATGGKHSPTACQSKKRWASYAGSGGKRGAMSSGSLS